MNERIKLLRKMLNLTQDEFSSKIGLSRNFIAQIETGTKNPSERTISDILREFKVNEAWLRTGKGDMFQEFPPEDETAAAISNVLEDIGCKDSIYTLVKELLVKYDRLDPRSKKVIEGFADDVIKGYIEKREEP